MKLKRWFFGGRKNKTRSKQELHFCELLRNMCFTYSFEQTSFLFWKKQVSLFPDLFLGIFCLLKNVFEALFFFLKKKPLIINHPLLSVIRKKFLKHLLLKLFCWGRREKSPCISFWIWSLFTFSEKSPFPSLYKCPFCLFLFRFVFPFLLFSFSLLCLTLFKKKNERRLDATDVPRTRSVTIDRTQTSLAQQWHRTRQWSRELSIAQAILDARKKSWGQLEAVKQNLEDSMVSVEDKKEGRAKNKNFVERQLNDMQEKTSKLEDRVTAALVIHEKYMSDCHRRLKRNSHMAWAKNQSNDTKKKNLPNHWSDVDAPLQSFGVE